MSTFVLSMASSVDALSASKGTVPERDDREITNASPSHINTNSPAMDQNQSSAVPNTLRSLKAFLAQTRKEVDAALLDLYATPELGLVEDEQSVSLSNAVAGKGVARPPYSSENDTRFSDDLIYLISSSTIGNNFSPNNLSALDIKGSPVAASLRRRNVSLQTKDANPLSATFAQTLVSDSTLIPTSSVSPTSDAMIGSFVDVNGNRERDVELIRLTSESSDSKEKEGTHNFFGLHGTRRNTTGDMPYVVSVTQNQGEGHGTVEQLDNSHPPLATSHSTSHSQTDSLSPVCGMQPSISISASMNSANPHLFVVSGDGSPRGASLLKPIPAIRHKLSVSMPEPNPLGAVNLSHEVRSHMFTPPALLTDIENKKRKSVTLATVGVKKESPATETTTVTGIVHQASETSTTDASRGNIAKDSVLNSIAKLFTITDTLMAALTCERQRRRREGKVLVGEIVRHRSNLNSKLTSPILSASAVKGPSTSLSQAQSSNLQVASANQVAVLEVTLSPSTTTNDLITATSSSDLRSSDLSLTNGMPVRPAELDGNPVSDAQKIGAQPFQWSSSSKLEASFSSDDEELVPRAIVSELASSSAKHAQQQKERAIKEKVLRSACRKSSDPTTNSVSDARLRFMSQSQLKNALPETVLANRSTDPVPFAERSPSLDALASTAVGLSSSLVDDKKPRGGDNASKPRQRSFQNSFGAQLFDSEGDDDADVETDNTTKEQKPTVAEQSTKTTGPTDVHLSGTEVLTPPADSLDPNVAPPTGRGVEADRIQLEGHLGRAGRLPIFVSSSDVVAGGGVLKPASSNNVFVEQEKFGSEPSSSILRDPAALGGSVLTGSLCPPSANSTYLKPLVRVDTRGPSDLVAEDFPHRPMRRRGSSKNRRRSFSRKAQHADGSTDSSKNSSPHHQATTGSTDTEEDKTESSSFRNQSPRRRRSTAAQSEVVEGDSEFTAEEGPVHGTLLATMDDGRAPSLPPQSRRPTIAEDDPVRRALSPPTCMEKDNSQTASTQFDHTPSVVPSGVFIRGARGSHSSSYPSHSLTAPPSYDVQSAAIKREDALLASQNESHQQPYELNGYVPPLYLAAREQVSRDNGRGRLVAGVDAILVDTFGHPSDPRSLWHATASQLENLLWQRQTEFEHEQRELTWLFQQRMNLVDEKAQWPSDTVHWVAREHDTDSVDFSVFQKRRADFPLHGGTAASSFTAPTTTIPNTIINDGTTNLTPREQGTVGVVVEGHQPRPLSEVALRLDSIELTAHESSSVRSNNLTTSLTSPLIGSSKGLETSQKSLASQYSRQPLTPTTTAPPFQAALPELRRHSPPSFTGGAGWMGGGTATSSSNLGHNASSQLFPRINESFMDSSFVRMTNNYSHHGVSPKGFASRNPSASSSFAQNTSSPSAAGNVPSNFSLHPQDPHDFYFHTHRFPPSSTAVLSAAGFHYVSHHTATGAANAPQIRRTNIVSEFTPPTTISNPNGCAEHTSSGAQSIRIEEIQQRVTSPSLDRVSSAAQDTRGPSAALEGSASLSATHMGVDMPAVVDAEMHPQKVRGVPSNRNDGFENVANKQQQDGIGSQVQNIKTASISALPASTNIPHHNGELKNLAPDTCQLMSGESQAPHASLLSINSAFVAMGGGAGTGSSSTNTYNQQIIRFGLESQSLGERPTVPNLEGNASESPLQPVINSPLHAVRRTVESPTQWSPTVRTLSGEVGHSQSVEDRPHLSLDHTKTSEQTTPKDLIGIDSQGHKAHKNSLVEGSETSQCNSKESPIIPSAPVPKMPSHVDHYVPAKQRRPSFISAHPVPASSAANSKNNKTAYRDPVVVETSELKLVDACEGTKPVDTVGNIETPHSFPQQGILMSGTHGLTQATTPRKSPARGQRERSIKMIVPPEDEGKADSAHVSPSKKVQQQDSPSKDDRNILVPISSATTGGNGDGGSGSANAHIDRYIPGERQHRPSYCEVSLSELNRKGAVMAIANKALREGKNSVEGGAIRSDDLPLSHQTKTPQKSEFSQRQQGIASQSQMQYSYTSPLNPGQLSVIETTPTVEYGRLPTPSSKDKTTSYVSVSPPSPSRIYSQQNSSPPQIQSVGQQSTIPLAVKEALRFLSGASTEELAWMWLRHEVERRGGEALLHFDGHAISKQPFEVVQCPLPSRDRGFSTISGVGSSNSGNNTSWPPSRTTSLPPTASCAFQSHLAPVEGKHGREINFENSHSVQKIEDGNKSQDGRIATSPSHDLMHVLDDEASPSRRAGLVASDASSGSPPSHPSQASKECSAATQRHTMNTSFSSAASPGVSNLIPLTVMGSHSHFQQSGREPSAEFRQEIHNEGPPLPSLLRGRDIAPSHDERPISHRSVLPALTNYTQNTLVNQLASASQRGMPYYQQFISNSSTAYGGTYNSTTGPVFIGVGSATPRTTSTTTSGKASPSSGMAASDANHQTRSLPVYPQQHAAHVANEEKVMNYQSNSTLLQHHSPLLPSRSNVMLRSAGYNNVAVGSYVAGPLNGAPFEGSMASISHFMPPATYITGARDNSLLQSTRSNNYTFSPIMGSPGGVRNQSYSASFAGGDNGARQLPPHLLPGRSSEGLSSVLPRGSMNFYGQFSNGLQSASNAHTTAAVWHEQREMLRQLKVHHTEAAKGPGVQRNAGTVDAADDGFDVLNQYTILDELGKGSTGCVLLAFDTKIEKFFAVKKMNYSTVQWQRELEQRKALAAKRNSASLSLLGSSLPPKAKSSVSVRPNSVAGLSEASTSQHPASTHSDRRFSTNPLEIELSPEEMIHPVDKEIQIMRSLHHPNIVELVEVIEDQDEQSIYLVMTYAKHGALTSVKGDLNQTAFKNQLALVTHAPPTAVQPDKEMKCVSQKDNELPLDEASDTQGSFALGTSPSNFDARLVPITAAGATPVSGIEGQSQSSAAERVPTTNLSCHDDVLDNMLTATVNSFSTKVVDLRDKSPSPNAIIGGNNDEVTPPRVTGGQSSQLPVSAEALLNANSPSAMESRLTATAENDGDGYLKILPSKYRLVCEPIRPLRRLRCLSKQIVEAVYYLHVFRHLVHRDIKPDNILMIYHEPGDEDSDAESTNKHNSDSSKAEPKSPSKRMRPQEGSKKWGRPLLTDFGQTERFHSNAPLLPPLKLAGTPAFFAPEVCNGDESGTAADIWSLGVTLFAMVFGMLPFAGRITRDMVGEISEGALAFPDMGTEKLVCWIEAEKRRKGGMPTQKTQKTPNVLPDPSEQQVPPNGDTKSHQPFDHSLCGDGPNQSEIEQIVAPFFEGDDTETVKNFTLEEKCETVITSLRWWKDLLSQIIRKNPNMRPSIRWVQRHHIFQTPLGLELHKPAPVGHFFSDTTSHVGGDYLAMKNKMMSKRNNTGHLQTSSRPPQYPLTHKVPLLNNKDATPSETARSSCTLTSLSPLRNQIRSSTRMFTDGQQSISQIIPAPNIPLTPLFHRTDTIAPGSPELVDRRSEQKGNTSHAETSPPPTLLSVAFAGTGSANHIASVSSALTFPTLTTMDSSSVATADFAADFAAITGGDADKDGNVPSIYGSSTQNLAGVSATDATKELFPPYHLHTEAQSSSTFTSTVLSSQHKHSFLVQPSPLESKTHSPPSNHLAFSHHPPQVEDNVPSSEDIEASRPYGQEGDTDTYGEDYEEFKGEFEIKDDEADESSPISPTKVVKPTQRNPMRVAVFSRNVADRIRSRRATLFGQTVTHDEPNEGAVIGGESSGFMVAQPMNVPTFHHLPSSSMNVGYGASLKGYDDITHTFSEGFLEVNNGSPSETTFDFVSPETPLTNDGGAQMRLNSPTADHRLRMLNATFNRTGGPMFSDGSTSISEMPHYQNPDVKEQGMMDQSSGLNLLSTISMLDLPITSNSMRHQGGGGRQAPNLHHHQNQLPFSKEAGGYLSASSQMVALYPPDFYGQSLTSVSPSQKGEGIGAKSSSGNSNATTIHGALSTNSTSSAGRSIPMVPPPLAPYRRYSLAPSSLSNLNRQQLLGATGMQGSFESSSSFANVFSNNTSHQFVTSGREPARQSVSEQGVGMPPLHPTSFHTSPPRTSVSSTSGAFKPNREPIFIVPPHGRGDPLMFDDSPDTSNAKPFSDNKDNNNETISVNPDSMAITRERAKAIVPIQQVVVEETPPRAPENFEDV